MLLGNGGHGRGLPSQAPLSWPLHCTAECRNTCPGKKLSSVDNAGVNIKIPACHISDCDGCENLAELIIVHVDGQGKSLNFGKNFGTQIRFCQLFLAVVVVPLHCRLFKSTSALFQIGIKKLSFKKEKNSALQSCYNIDETTFRVNFQL